MKQAKQKTTCAKNPKQPMISPTDASAITRYSKLGNKLRSGKLAAVKPLEKNHYEAASAIIRQQAHEQIKNAITKTLAEYSTIWRPAENKETTRKSFKVLLTLPIKTTSFEETVKQIIRFFKKPIGHWRAGKKDPMSRRYRKDKRPSIKPLLMKNLLTIPLFNTTLDGDTLTLITQELTHGLRYKLDLTKDYFGGCNINGLICFFENQCKRFAGLEKPAKIEDDLTVTARTI